MEVENDACERISLLACMLTRSNAWPKEELSIWNEIRIQECNALEIWKKMPGRLVETKCQKDL